MTTAATATAPASTTATTGRRTPGRYRKRTAARNAASTANAASANEPTVSSVGCGFRKQAQNPVDPAQIQKQARDARNKQREPCDEAEIDDARFGTHRRPLDVGARAERLPDQHEVGKRAGHDGPRPRSAKEQVEHNEHAEHPCPSPRTRNGAATRCRRPMAGGFAAPGVRKNRRRRSAPHPGPPNASPSMAQKAPLGYDTVS